MKITIDRKRWGKTYLYNPRTDCYCAVGFLCKALGVPDQDMAYRASPEGLCEVPPDLFATGIVVTGEYCPVVSTNRFRKIATANDRAAEVRREQGVRDAFAEVGVEVEFV